VACCSSRSPTGFCLATAYGIVKQSGGNLACASEVGRSTVFSLYLPRQCPRDCAREGDDDPVDSTTSGSSNGVSSVRETTPGTILVIEDEAAVRAQIEARRS
jgi:two-component system cell cycle sensor histidine kinase/response regulator CckA